MVDLSDCTPLAKILIRGRPDGRLTAALGVRFGRTVRGADGLLVAGLLPEGWLVLGPPESGATMVRRLDAIGDDGFVSVVDVTHGLALVRLTGSAAAAVLAALCPIDLADAVTPDSTVFCSLVAGITATVIRDDLHGTRSYLLLCDRSCGQYLIDVLLDEGATLEV